jgi:hypothetical protein
MKIAQESPVKKRILIVILALITFLFVFSCDSAIPTYTFTFINYSYYNITISPNEQSWEGFILQSGTSHEVTTSSNPISYRYNYAGVVYPIGSGNGIITFYNRY